MFDLQAKLREYAAMSLEEQYARASEIEETFRSFLREGPTESQFAFACGGLVLTARMLYMLAKDS